jgi:hypothetical protein
MSVPYAEAAATASSNAVVKRMGSLPLLFMFDGCAATFLCDAGNAERVRCIS